MNITVDQLLAKIGRLSVQVDLLIEENTMLKNVINANAPKPEVKAEPKETP
jgi:hypothetical protein